MKTLFQIIKESPLIVRISLSIALLLTILISIDSIATKSIYFDGIVIDKHFQPSSNSIGTGYVSNTNGSDGIFVNVQHKEEKFTLMVKMKNSEIVSVKCTPEIYYKKQIGDDIKCVENIGCISGLKYSCNGIE